MRNEVACVAQGVFSLFWIGSHMAAVVTEGAGASAQDRNVALKTLEQCFKATNFTTGAVEVFVIL